MPLIPVRAPDPGINSQTLKPEKRGGGGAYPADRIIERTGYRALCSGTFSAAHCEGIVNAIPEKNQKKISKKGLSLRSWLPLPYRGEPPSGLMVGFLFYDIDQELFTDRNPHPAREYVS